MNVNDAINCFLARIEIYLGLVIFSSIFRVALNLKNSCCEKYLPEFPLPYSFPLFLPRQ